MSSETNGLEMKTVDTSVKIYEGQEIKSFDDLQDKIGLLFNDTGYGVAYIDYKVLVGKYDNSLLVFYNNEVFNIMYLQKIRVFNAEKELFIWRRGENLFNMRLRSDSGGEKQYVVDAEQVLWGTRQKTLEAGWSKIFESRGMEIILPFTSNRLDENEYRVKIKTRNYIAFNQVGQAGYVDSRFMKFVPGGD